MPCSVASEIGYYLSFQSFSHSEPIAIKAIVEDWDGRQYSGNTALSYNRAEIGISWDKWRIGLVQRYDNYYEFSSSTAELIHSIKNQNVLTPGEQYQLKLSANTLEASGLRFSYQDLIGGVNYDLAVSYLQGKRFINGSLSGDADVVSEKDYDFLFDVDYYYYRDKLFDRKVAEPDGQGYAIDFKINWQAGSQWQVELEAVDILARMYWKNAPRTIAVANSSTKEFDENGFVIYRPVIFGLETNQDFTQKTPRKIFIRSSYEYENKYPVLFEYQDYKIKRFYSLGYRYIIGNMTKIDFLYNFTAKALKFHYEGDWYLFELIVDEIDIKKARTFGVNFSIKKYIKIN